MISAVYWGWIGCDCTYYSSLNDSSLNDSSLSDEERFPTSIKDGLDAMIVRIIRLLTIRLLTICLLVTKIGPT